MQAAIFFFIFYFILAIVWLQLEIITFLASDKFWIIFPPKLGTCWLGQPVNKMLVENIYFSSRYSVISCFFSFFSFLSLLDGFNFSLPYFFLFYFVCVIVSRNFVLSFHAICKIKDRIALYTSTMFWYQFIPLQNIYTVL